MHAIDSTPYGSNIHAVQKFKGEPFNHLFKWWFDPRFLFLVLVVFQSLAIFSASSCTYM